MLVSQLPAEGWLEDPVFYRSGEIMFGIISHEGAAILEATAAEQGDVASMGIVTRDIPPWDPDFDETAV